MDNDLRDDLISAALDGERVEVEALRAALGTAEGRDSLAAFVLLRAATATDDVAPERWPEHVPVIARARRSRWLLAAPRVPVAWAASLAVLAIAASFWFGTTLRAPTATLVLVAPPTAPVATLATPIVDAATAAFAGSQPSDQGPRVAAASRLHRPVGDPPKPTRVLRFVPGVDWTSAPE